MSWRQVMYWALVVALYPFMVIICMALTPFIGFLLAREEACILTRRGF